MTSNIPASIIDPFYRYKRDNLRISGERKKGTQTRIENLDRISAQLNVSEKRLRQSLSKSIGSRISGNLIAGTFEISKIEKALEDFIFREVLLF